MLGIFKRNKEKVPEEPIQSLAKETPKPNFLTRLKSGLSRTRENLAGGLADLVLGKKEVDSALVHEIESRLLMADVGVKATAAVIAELNQNISRKEVSDGPAVFRLVRHSLEQILAPCCRTWQVDEDKKPYVILMVGVNGSGKTTTIGKLARYFQEQNKKVMLAAGDTFRAAAIEQLQVWGERNAIPVIAQKAGADSASVIFDAFTAAKSRNMDVLLADTAGRLHTQQNLMDELKKVKRVLGKLDETAPHEVWLVLDAGIGQNAINQAKQFHQAMGVTGLVLTKLDGTAKGGVIFAIAQELGLPIYFIGVGETIDDLRPFNSHDFIETLFSMESGA